MSPQPQQEEASNTQSTFEQNFIIGGGGANDTLFNSIFRSTGLGGLFGQNGNANSAGTTTNSSNTTTNTRRRNATRIVRTTFNTLECREAIEQNVNTINNIIECGEYNCDDFNRQNFECFDVNKRKLVPGQWVDVKDTVEQWLEAQVLEVKDDNSAVYVHYNGWGNRWNEWIPMNSPRIMPFRFHTKQKTVTNFCSPTPNRASNIMMIAPTASTVNNGEQNSNSNGQQNESANDNQSSQTNNSSNNVNCECDKDFLDLFKEVNSITSVSNNLINSIINQKDIDINEDKESNIPKEENKPKSKEHNQLKMFYNIKRLIPLLDKTGRLYTDMSTYLNYSIQSNRLFNLNKNLYSDVSTNNLLKPYTEEENRQVREELLANYTERETRSNTVNLIQPANRFDRKFNHQIPLIGTPLHVERLSGNGPHQYIDVYFHTIVNPIVRRDNQQGGNERTDESEGNNHTENNINNINLNNINTNEEGNQNGSNVNNNNIPNEDKMEIDNENSDLLGKKRKNEETEGKKEENDAQMKDNTKPNEEDKKETK